MCIRSFRARSKDDAGLLDGESRIYSHCTVKDAFRDAYCRSICMFLDDVNKCRRLCRTDFMLTMWNCQMNWVGLSFPSSNYGIKLLLVRLMTARVLGLLCYVIHCYLGCHMDLVLIDLVFFYNFYDKFIQWLKCSSTFPHISPYIIELERSCNTVVKWILWIVPAFNDSTGFIIAYML